MKLSLSSQIESILFWKGEAMSISALSKILGKSEKEITEAISKLKESLEDRGISMIEKEDEVLLVTNPEMSEIFDKIVKDDLTKDLSRAALETLSIIVYRGPIKRSELDYIRGVNSQFILRALLVRGLIEKVVDKKDERSYLYQSSFDLLRFLGIDNQKNMPDYESVERDIKSFILERDGNTEDNTQA